MYYISYSHPDLQLHFYYYTSDNDRYYEGNVPHSTNQQSTKSIGDS